MLLNKIYWEGALAWAVVVVMMNTKKQLVESLSKSVTKLKN